MMQEAKTLTGSVVEQAALDQATREAMFALMDRAYLVDRATFFRDLAGKDWAIVLRDDAGQVRGFTSLSLWREDVGGRPVRTLFSGDTIIEPEFWGSLELPRTWGRFMLRLIDEAGSEELYWFLISSGYKTYRFLPVFFKEFFPRTGHATPAELQEVLDHVATRRFGQRYDPTAGVIRLEFPTPLRAGVADLPAERLRDPDTAFFLSRNPGHLRGEELACLARLCLENLRPFIRRVLREGKPAAPSTSPGST